MKVLWFWLPSLAVSGNPHLRNQTASSPEWQNWIWGADSASLASDLVIQPARNEWTDDALKAFRELQAEPLTVATFVDFNGDGKQDIVFLDASEVQRPDGIALRVMCASSYRLCYRQELPTSDALKDYHAHSLIAADFAQRNQVDFLVVFRQDRLASKASRPLSVFQGVPIRPYMFALYRRSEASQPGTHPEGDGEGAYDIVWISSESVAVPPILIDFDFDGYLDLLTQDPFEEYRVVYLNRDKGRRFELKKWNELGDYVDLESYSAVGRANLSHLSAMAPPSSEAKEESTSWWRKVFQKLSFGITKRPETRDDSEQEFLSQHERDGKPGLSSASAPWSPRPLPLKENTPIAPIQGHALVDFDGDCVADLGLIVASPDFEGRFELEIWITETVMYAGVGPRVKRRLWRGQRILLPQGVQAIALDDFSNAGGTDLVVLACDLLSVVLTADRETDVQTSCAGAERLFLMKSFHLPLCASRNGMPEMGDADCMGSGQLCRSAPFAFGGIDDGLRRSGVSVSDIRFTEEARGPRLVASGRFPPLLRVADIDRDGYPDIFLLVAEPDKPVSVRVLRNSAPKGELPVAHEKELVTVMTDMKLAWFETRTIQEHIRQAFVVAFVGLKSILKILTAGSAPMRDPSKARRFEAVQSLTLTDNSSQLYAAGFLEDQNSNRQLDIVTFSSGPSNASIIHVFGHSSLCMQLSNAAETNFFLGVTVLNDVHPTCKNGGVSLPALGSVVGVTITGLDGIKYPVRKSRSQENTLGVLQPRSTYIGVGQSSNYIETMSVGYPFAGADPPSCLPDSPAPVPYASLSTEQFSRRWVALMPNSEMVVTAGLPRWKSSLWMLILSVKPSKEVFRIVVGTVASLAVVGMLNFVLARREKAAVLREQAKFRRRFLA